LENEEKYKAIKAEILGENSDDSGSGSGDDDSSEEDEDEGSSIITASFARLD
jgi:pre-mRNA-splicing factor CWC22